MNDFDFEPLPARPPKPRKKKPKTLEQKIRFRNKPSTLRNDAKYRLRVAVLRQQQFEEQYLRIRVAQIARDIEADKRWLKEYAEREAAHARAEAEMKRIRDWFTNERAKEAAKAKRS